MGIIRNVAKIHRYMNLYEVSQPERSPTVKPPSIPPSVSEVAIKGKVRWLSSGENRSSVNRDISIFSCDINMD